MKIVPFSEKHLDAVAEIERLTFSVPWTKEMLRESLALDMAHFLVCEENGVAVGYAGMYTSKYDGAITNVAVHPDFRSKGVGGAIMSALIEDGRKMKIEALTLEVRVSNTRAQSFYERLGFERVGTRRGFYSSPREDAVIMNYTYK